MLITLRIRLARVDLLLPEPLKKMEKFTLTELNEMNVDAFVAALGHIYEHSPWVVEQAAVHRPFDTVAVAHAACEAALFAADPRVQIELIQAHPDLAAKLDQIPKLTEFSKAEQTRAGFGTMNAEVLDQMREALEVYRVRFKHPFILCVAEHPAEDVLPLLALRCGASPEAERLACIYQIARIGWHRLVSLIR